MVENDASSENVSSLSCSSDDELHIYDNACSLCRDSTIFYQDAISSSLKTYSTGSSSSKTDRFVAMGFSRRIVMKAIGENGEDDEASILDSLLTYTVPEKSPPQCQSEISVTEPSPSESESNIAYDLITNVDTSSAIAKKSNESLEKEEKLWLLVDMGYPTDAALTAVDKCGPDAQIAELTDFICAAEMEKELEDVRAREIPDEDEKSQSHSSNLDFLKKKKRKLNKDEKQRSRGCWRECAKEEKIYIPNPLIGFSIPDQSWPMVERKLPESAAGPPFFYYENVALTPKGVWSKISRFLYDIEPEFVDSIYFCACARKRGYIHNLPIHNRFSLLPRPPRAIQEALPWTKEWWPYWDRRTKLNCINTSHGTAKVTERIRKALEKYDSELEPPLHVQKYVLHECRKWNLVWVGRNKVAPIEPNEMEMLMGFPRDHTRGGGVCNGDRHLALGNAFQVDTVAYHLSVLKEEFPTGINVLSLFSGIGGAEVALHRLGIPLKNVVSVEISVVNKNILRSWWQQTNQSGTLIEWADVQEVSKDKLEEWISLFGGFDLVIGGSPCNNLTGSNRVSRVGLEGEQSSLFYEYFRILDLVKMCDGKSLMTTCR